MAVGEPQVESGSVPDSNKRPTVPLWEQVLAELRLRIASGEFTDRFPPDRELVAEFHVSRHTVREAVRQLHRQGTLERRRGRGGTRVRRMELEQPAGVFYSLYRSVEAHGVPQRSTVLSLELRDDRVAARKLEVAASEDLVFLKRIRHSGDAPLALDRIWLPASIASPLLAADFRDVGVYDELEQRCGIVMDAAWERVGPATPSAEERELLRLPRGQAVFAIERLILAQGKPVEWRLSLVRGDRYAFVVEWPRGTRHLSTTFDMVTATRL